MQRRLAFGVVFAVVGCSAAAIGCSIATLWVSVPQSFSVAVTNELGPVAGLKIRLEPVAYSNVSEAGCPDHPQEAIEAVTDAKGLARFRSPYEGCFSLALDHPTGTPVSWQSYLFKVGGQAAASFSPIKLSWPDTAILRTKSAAGKIEDGLMRRASAPVAGATVRLRAPVTFTELRSTTTAEDGEFTFAGTTPGFYLLEIAPGDKNTHAPSGDIPILIAEPGPQNLLVIAVQETDCGLMYDRVENKASHLPSYCVKGSGEGIPCP
jgi:hypothetical protein